MGHGGRLGRCLRGWVWGPVAVGGGAAAAAASGVKGVEGWVGVRAEEGCEVEEPPWERQNASADCTSSISHLHVQCCCAGQLVHGEGGHQVERLIFGRVKAQAQATPSRLFTP
eukprot:1151348-Pelagomonas_calceolata.AAC.2